MSCNTPAMRRRLTPAGPRLCMAMALILVMPAPIVGQTEPLYRYRASDGSMVFSDSPAAEQGQGYKAYRGSYGRPAAVLSCIGMSSAAIDARAAAFRPQFQRAAQRHQLDPLLLQAIARVESCFDPDAVSSVGARGLMQLMPDTATELGVRNSFDAAENIAGGARYYARMLARFRNDQTLALAAYNAGPGAVRRHDGIPPYPETELYVRRVIATRARYATGAARSASGAMTEQAPGAP